MSNGLQLRLSRDGDPNEGMHLRCTTGCRVCMHGRRIVRRGQCELLTRGVVQRQHDDGATHASHGNVIIACTILSRDRVQVALQSRARTGMRLQNRRDENLQQVRATKPAPCFNRLFRGQLNNVLLTLKRTCRHCILHLQYDEDESFAVLEDLRYLSLPIILGTCYWWRIKIVNNHAYPFQTGKQNANCGLLGTSETFVNGARCVTN